MNFQDKLKVQKVNFANECSELLQHVSDIDINDDRRHRSWRDPGLEEKVKARLEENYDACVSALRLINGSLTDILRETGTLDILTEHVSSYYMARERVWIFSFFSLAPKSGKRVTLS